MDLLILIPPLLIAKIIDELQGGKNLHSIYMYTGLLFFVEVSNWICRYGWMHFMAKTSHRIVRDVRHQVLVKLRKLPPVFYHHNSVGDLLGKCTSDMRALRFAMGPGVITIIDSLILITFIPILLFSLNKDLTLLLIIPLAFIPWIVYVNEGKINFWHNASQERFSELSGFVQESVIGIRIIRCFAVIKEFSNKFLKNSEKLRELRNSF